MIFQAIYYYYFRSWLPINIIGIVGATIIYIFVALTPESPKFLYATQQFEQARASLQVIQKINQKPGALIGKGGISNTTFDTENALSKQKEEESEDASLLKPEDS